LRNNGPRGWEGKPRRRVGVQSEGWPHLRKINTLASSDEFLGLGIPNFQELRYGGTSENTMTRQLGR
jgi:hypothetical protein